MTNRLAAQVTAGFLTDKFLKALIERLEIEVEERGWDAPCALFELYNETGDDQTRRISDNIDVSVRGHDLDGHPLDDLCGYVTPPECLGIALSFEGYRTLDHSGLQESVAAPPEISDRVEDRVLLVLTADGRFGELSRTRGCGEARWDKDSFQNSTDVELDSRIVWALYAMLEAPVATTRYNVLEEVCQPDALDPFFRFVLLEFNARLQELEEASPDTHAFLTEDPDLVRETLIQVAEVAFQDKLVPDWELWVELFTESLKQAEEPGDWFGPAAAAMLCAVPDISLQCFAGVLLNEPSETIAWLGTAVVAHALRNRRVEARREFDLGVYPEVLHEPWLEALEERGEKRVALVRALSDTASGDLVIDTAVGDVADTKGANTKGESL